MGSVSRRDKIRALQNWHHEVGVEITDTEIRLILYSGDVVVIDRYERAPSTLIARIYPGALEVLPRADNAVEIRPRSDSSTRRNKNLCRKPKKPAPPSKSV
jgi:hypothetical protein